MKTRIGLLIACVFLIHVSFAQQAIYEVTVGNGNGIRFWQNDLFKIHMGTGSEYQYGPVMDYSIKMNMSNNAGRGWTWGTPGSVPIGALSISGDMKIAGAFTSNALNISSTLNSQWGNTASFVAPNIGPNTSYIHWGTTGDWYLRSSTTTGRVILQDTGGNVGIGTSQPNSTLSVKGRIGIRADAGPSTPTETLRVEGAITSEENVVNITNLADQDFLVRLSGVGAGTKRTIIGPSVSNRFSLGVGVMSNNEHLTIINGGNVGIGTVSPSTKLEVAGDVKLSSRMNFATANAYTNSSYGVVGLQTGTPGKNLVFYNYDGPINELMTLNGTTGTAAINNGGLTVTGNVGVGTTSPGTKLHVFASTTNSGDNSAKFEAPNIGNNVSHIHWGTTGDWYIRSANSTGKVIIQDAGGNVGIGTSNPNQKLTVNGTIYGKEVKVDLSVPGPDYVFEKGYSLPSLEEIKKYIDANKHLPEVPSAKEMEANGINVGEMNVLLLKKIEELTLYMIDTRKEIDVLKSENENLKKMILNSEK